MRSRSGRLESLASPAFVAALAVLVVNDFVLKPAFHNALTGKLSDFAGLFALSLFVATIAPRQRAAAGALLAVAFSFWKTSYAEPFIEWLNALSPFAIGRTVDLTDLIALPAIALGIWVAPRLKAWPLPKLAQLGLAAVALVAFTATSRARYVARDTLDLTQAGTLAETELQELFDDVAEQRGLRCDVCAPLSEGRVYVPIGNSDIHSLVVELAGRRTLTYTVTGYDSRGDIRSLARRLARELAARFPDVQVIDRTAEFVQVVEGGTTVVAIRVPNAKFFEVAAQTVSSIVADVARSHGLEADDAARVHYLPGFAYLDPEDQELAVSVVDRRGTLLVRLNRRSSRVETLHRALSADLLARLTAEFGGENVVMHDVPALPPERLF